jgi:hypothetical protein
LPWSTESVGPSLWFLWSDPGRFVDHGEIVQDLPVRVYRLSLRPMATLRLCRTFWGVDDALDPAKWDTLFDSVVAEGYSVRGLC